MGWRAKISRTKATSLGDISVCSLVRKGRNLSTCACCVPMPINFLLVCKSRLGCCCCRSLNPALVMLSMFAGDMEAKVNWWKVKSIRQASKQTNKQKQQHQPPTRAFLEAAKRFRSQRSVTRFSATISQTPLPHEWWISREFHFHFRQNIVICFCFKCAMLSFVTLRFPFPPFFTLLDDDNVLCFDGAIKMICHSYRSFRAISSSTGFHPWRMSQNVYLESISPITSFHYQCTSMSWYSTDKCSPDERAKRTQASV